MSLSQVDFAYPLSPLLSVTLRHDQPLPRSPGFDPGAVNVGFVADKVAPVEVSLPVLRLSHVSITVPKLHTYLHTDTTFIRRTSGRRVGTYKQSRALSDIGTALDRTLL